MPHNYAIDDAAAAALYSLSRAPTEHIGALYGDDLSRSNFYESSSNEKVRGRLQIPGGAAAIRALMHNHPKAYNKSDLNRHRFSPGDKEAALSLGVPSYIAIDDRIRRYDPSTDTTDDVLAQIPLEEIRRLYLAEGLKR